MSRVGRSHRPSYRLQIYARIGDFDICISRSDVAMGTGFQEQYFQLIVGGNSFDLVRNDNFNDFEMLTSSPVGSALLSVNVIDRCEGGTNFETVRQTFITMYFIFISLQRPNLKITS